ncbi:hypothetical protein FRC15_011204 [Serendipita sp. 397]|nr:hypothetical protein FRC15_011204 [Serendipita sp. 397]KAG8803578.1 hypothetical protein FRC16_004451 [Serendipita sp. 398]
MPLFSSSSVRDSNSGGHHNKLEKSPHGRSSSLTEKRKIGGLFGRRGTTDEGASTMAVAGSSARLQKDDTNDSVAVPPLTPKSINGEPAPDDIDLANLPPTPPPAGEKYGNAINAASGMNDFTQKDGSMRTSSTWRDNHDSTRHKGGLGHSDLSPAFAATSMGYHNAHQNAADNLGSYTRDGTDAGATGSGGQHGGADYKTDWGTYGQHDYSHEPMDLTTARKKVQFAIEAELAADSALELARHAVQEARNAVKAIERQIHEEFEKAQTRKLEVDGVLKDLNKLGRHDYKH